MNRLVRTIMVVAMSGLFAASTRASLLGDSVDFVRQFQTGISDSQSAIVTDTGIPEFYIQDLMTFDISADGFVFTAVKQTGFSHLTPHVIRISSLDWLGDPGGIITGLTFDFSGFTASGVAANKFSYTDHSVTWDVSGLLPVNIGDSLRVGFITSHGDVPIPSTLALFGIALACLSCSKRKAA